MADIAKAEGKSLASVKSAVKAATETRADKAVKDATSRRRRPTGCSSASTKRSIVWASVATVRAPARRRIPIPSRERSGPIPADPADAQPAGDAVTS